MNHNLLGAANEVQYLVDDAGRPHLDKVARGASLMQVLNGVGYDAQGLVEGFSQNAAAAEGQSRLSAEERQSMSEAFQSTLDSYTYLED
jgi:arginine decarboxylase-like protein